MRPHGALVPVLGLLWIACCWTPAQAADAPPFAGTVRDTLGRVLEDVEILFARIPSETFRPTAVARTDPHGQFRLAGLAPGLYRVAALKRGYRTFVGQVDTLVRRPLELVLHPAEELDAASLPRDASWALRLPRRGMLHETDARPVDERAEMRPSSAPSSRDELSLELEQYFSVGAAAVESDTEDADIQASETSMRLASSLGERGTIRVAGRRERLGNPEMRGTNDAAASQHGAAVSLDLSYDTSPDGQLAVSAYFNQTDYALAALDPSGPSALQQQQETWGYDARWSRQIDERQRFAVGVGYRDASLAGPWRPALAGLVPALARDAAPVEMFHRAMRAEGSYASVLADGHDLEVSVRARMLRTPEPTPFDPSPVSEGAASWMVEADAQDTWAVSAPFSLVYGLGYRHSLVDRDAMLVAPRVGGRLQAGGVSVSALVSYHTSAGSGRRGAPEVERPFRPGNSLGYRAEVEFPLAYQVRLRGGVSYSPIQLEYFGYLHGDDGLYEHPLYLTDGNTAVTERSLTLTEERGGGRTFVEFTDGLAEGAVAPLLPFDTGFPLVADRDLSYRSGRIGVLFPSSGTDVRVEYRRVRAERPTFGSEREDSRQESVEVRVKQDVGGLEIPGDWRVLLALRLATVERNEFEAWAANDGEESVEALNRRFSAGLSVLF